MNLKQKLINIYNQPSEEDVELLEEFLERQVMFAKEQGVFAERIDITMESMVEDEINPLKLCYHLEQEGISFTKGRTNALSKGFDIILDLEK